MRSVIALTTAAALVMAGFPVVPSYAEPPAAPGRAGAEAPDPAVINLFKAYPNGGEKLSKGIADLIVSNRKLAPNLANYVVNTPGLSKAQKIAAERGMAAALERLGINAADIYTKAPPAPPPVAPVEAGFNPLWLLVAAAVIGGIICAFECVKNEETVAKVTKS
jgi:hypothetical protein